MSVQKQRKGSRTTAMLHILETLAAGSKIKVDLQYAARTNSESLNGYLAILEQGGMVTKAREGFMTRYTMTEKGQAFLGMMHGLEKELPGVW